MSPTLFRPHVSRATTHFLLFAPLLLTALAHAQPPSGEPEASSTHVRRYREKTGAQVSSCTVTTHAAGAGVTSVVVSYAGEQYAVETDATGAARRIDITPREGQPRRFVRQGRILRYTVGDTTKTLRIDEAPLLQSAFMLSGFARSPARELEHWTATTSGEADGDVVKLVARKEGRERIRIGGVEVDALKIVLTLPGFRGLFWKSHYWLRPSDGVVLRYEEPRGASGTETTVGELTSE